MFKNLFRPRRSNKENEEQEQHQQQQHSTNEIVGIFKFEFTLSFLPMMQMRLRNCWGYVLMPI